MFDVGSCIGFRRKNCSYKSPCCGLVFLYAWMGLHRYNLLEVGLLQSFKTLVFLSLFTPCLIQFLLLMIDHQGTNLDISHVKRYNMTLTLAASYYITLVAMDPSSGKLVHFQTNVNEECCGKFALTSFIARPRRGNYLTYLLVVHFCCIHTLLQLLIHPSFYI